MAGEVNALTVVVPVGPIDDVHRLVLVAALGAEGWDRTRVAKRLGLSRKTVYNWMHRLGVVVSEPGGSP